MNRFALKLLIALLMPAAVASTASAQVALEQQNAVYNVDSTYMRPGTYTLPAFADGSQLQLTFDYGATSGALVIVQRAIISAAGLTEVLPPPTLSTSTSTMCPANTVEVCTQRRGDDFITEVCECQTPGGQTALVRSGMRIDNAKDNAS